VKIYRAHKIELRPNKQQTSYFVNACGVARFAYNWGLGEWKQQHALGEKPSASKLSKQFNQIKRQEFPFVLDVAKTIAARAFRDLGHAFSNFFRSLKTGQHFGYPRFKRRGKHDSFYLANDRIKLDGKRIRVSKLGWVRMTEPLRLQGKIMSAVISRTADKWFCSIRIEIEITDIVAEGPTVGVDVGIKELATVSDGRTFENSRAFRQGKRQLRRLDKAVSRKKPGSQNYRKAIRRLQRQYYRITCVRLDAIHKATTAITKGAGRIVIENLNIKGMMRNHCIAGALQDASLAEVHRQPQYKAEQLGIEVIIADRFYPSSKTCSGCGAVKTTLTLKERQYKCSRCGLEIDRDLNAAINLKQVAEGSSATACRLGSSGLAAGQLNETTDWAGTPHNAAAQQP